MRSLLLIVFSSLGLAAFAQRDTLDIKLSADFFTPSELKDSSYTKVTVTKHVSWEEETFSLDTIFLADFDVNGRAVFMKKREGFADSATWKFTYDGEEIKSEEMHRYSGEQRFRRHWNSLSEFENNRVMATFFGTGGKFEEIPTKYYYNDKDQLVRSAFVKAGEVYETTYKYDGNGILQSWTRVETFGNMKDSIFYQVELDEAGRIMEERMCPSPTYMKTMDLDCSVGLYEYKRFRYDSLGRKIFQSDLSPDFLKTISYTSVAFKQRTYNGHGFVEQTFTSKGDVWATDVYHFYESKGWNGRFLLETFNDGTKLTEYLSTESSLPKRIQLNRAGAISTYVFIYEK